MRLPTMACNYFAAAKGMQVMSNGASEGITSAGCQTAKRQENVAVCVVQLLSPPYVSQYLLTQCPVKGLKS